MAKRTLQQINGDIAAGNVELIFYRAGWASDRVLSDYGEDLVVQPIQPTAAAGGGTVDHFRLLVQVKGTQAKTKSNGDWVIFIKKSHIARWIRSAEQVVLAAWHLKKRECRFILPSDHFSIADFELGAVGTQAVTFSSSRILNSQRLSELAWRVRQKHLSRDLLVFNNQIEELDSRLDFIAPPKLKPSPKIASFFTTDYHADERQVLEEERSKLESLRNRIVDEFLVLLQLFDADGMLVSIQEEWLSAFESIPDEALETDEGIYDVRFFYGTMMVRGAAKRLWGGSVDKVVMDACAARFLDLLPEDPTTEGSG